jgi:hypothetical protein
MDAWMWEWVTFVIALVIMVGGIGLLIIIVNSSVSLLHAILQTNWGKPIESYVYMTFCSFFCAFYFCLILWSASDVYHCFNEDWSWFVIHSVTIFCSAPILGMLLNILSEGVKRIRFEEYQRFRNNVRLQRIHRDINNL